MRRAAMVALTIGLALAVACGADDGGSSTATPGGLTPAGTKDTTPTPAPTGPGGGPPAPGDPTLDEELTELTAGSLTEPVLPGAVIDIDPLGITAADIGRTPSCTNFAFDFTWQVQSPYPPDGVDLVWRLLRDGEAIEIGSGPAGEQSVGCGVLEAENRGAMNVSIAIRYRAGAIE